MTGDNDNVTATSLIYNQKPEGSVANKNTSKDECCFCSRELECIDSSEVISRDYFTDYDLINKNTGSVCIECAYCMMNKPLKNGHWIVTKNEYISISTSNLKKVFCEIISGNFDVPYALHVSSNPILSEHAYLKTPVCHNDESLLFDYNGDTIRTSGEELFKIVDGIEVLRWYKFRLDDIRSSEPPVYSVDRVGVQHYKQIDEFLSKYTSTPIFEVAITLSNSRVDQDRDEEGIQNLIDKHDWK